MMRRVHICVRHLCQFLIGKVKHYGHVHNSDMGAGYLMCQFLIGQVKHRDDYHNTKLKEVSIPHR